MPRKGKQTEIGDKSRGNDLHQMEIDWGQNRASSPMPVTTDGQPVGTENPTLRLQWDFRTSFPEPTEQAIASGIINAEDVHLENIRAIHDEHAREMLMTLSILDAVCDAKRQGVDPATGHAPKTAAARERLQKLYETEPPRLEQWWRNLLGSYQDAFGEEAADAFGKAIQARHAGIEVMAETKQTPTDENKAEANPPSLDSQPPSHAEKVKSRRARHCLPVPRPLPSAIAADRFGVEENNKPVRPGPAEVRAITENHADKLIGLLDELHSAPPTIRDRLQDEYEAGVAAYAEDFGEDAARRLRSYVERQARLDPGSRHER